MDDQFMQEIQEEESALAALEKKVSEAAGGNVAVEAADEIIRANGEAQAIEIDALKDTVRAYQVQIDALRELYARNSALVDELRKMNVETTRGIQDVMKASSDALSRNSDALRDVDFGRMQEDGRALIGESAGKVMESVAESQKKIELLLQQSDDFSHKENVRVYRNVQASTEQLLKKQTDELRTDLEELKKPRKSAVTGIQVLTLLAALACVALEVMQLLGVFPLF